LQALLVLIKGLPLAYNRDLQEDKPRLFDSVDTVLACLDVAAPMIAGATLQRESIAGRLESGFLDATTFMEYLIGRGIPQRTAHHLVGALVRKAMDRGVPLAELALSEFQQAHPDLDNSVYDVLGVDKAVAAFRSYGSTCPDEVARQVAIWKTRIHEIQNTGTQSS
ncbi:MAG: argininosuccinate lyase, partial [Planctomycetales bacterium]|nr:argininosuccinate lyase [Planctomycetales bacterium]